MTTSSAATTTVLQEKVKDSASCERAYAPIWKALRKKKTVTVAVLDPIFLSRLKRAVSKEKDEDVGFKLLNDIEKPRLKYEWNEEKGELKISLVSRVGLVEIKG